MNNITAELAIFHCKDDSKYETDPEKLTWLIP
jgi:hypothetical protein